MLKDVLVKIRSAIVGAECKMSRREQAERRFDDLLQTLGTKFVAIDCGANVGDVAEPLARTGAQLFCYEPDHAIAEKLANRLAPYPNATVVQAAVSTYAGKALLFRSRLYDQDPESYSARNTIQAEALTRDIDGSWTQMDGDSAYMVDVINLLDTLENLISEHGKIDLLKIDIEGAEVDILEAIEQRQLFEYIDVTLAEMHVRRFPDDRRRTEALIARLEAAFTLSKVNLHWR